MTVIHTSETHPIRVDWLPGRPVGITFAPGKRGLSRTRGIVHWRDLDADLERLRAVERVDVLVCLLEAHEFIRLTIPDYRTRAKAHGLRVLRLPILDGGLPEVERCVRLLARVKAELARGKRVAIHCAGGLGRAGTVAGCLLRSSGMGPDETLRTLRKARGPHCPETKAQVTFVRQWSIV